VATPRSGAPGARGLLPWVALLVVWIVWGSTYLAIAVVVREMPPFAAAGVRFLAAGLVMATVASLVDRGRPRPSPRQLADYALIGILLLGIGNAFVMWAEKTIPSGTAALLVATVPLWIVFLDGLRPGGQPWSWRGWLGTALGLLGVAFVARPRTTVEASHWAGIAGLQVACVAWTVGSLYAQSRPAKLPLATASAVEMLAGGLALLAESTVARESWASLGAASSGAWLGLGYLVAFGSLVGFTAFAYCLETLPAATVGTYAYVNPVVAVALGHVVLGEKLSADLLGGAGLIVAAVVLTSRRPPRRREAR
jgi:drug/metabolite transporter (DMT)-like permease